MFLGEYQLPFTGQGRIILPRKFREEIIGKEIILSRGLDGCIFGFDKGYWEKEAARQLEIPITDEEARNLRRYFFSAAERIVLDGQGRFVIPKLLLDFAGLDERVVLIGAGDHFEIWDPQKWGQLINKLINKTNEKD